MTVAQSLIAFTVAATILAITPGLDTALVVRTATVEGPRRAGAAAAGIALGCLTWGGAVALGLGFLLTASEVAFTALKWTGAAYLFYLGLRLILQPRKRFDLDIASDQAAQPSGAVHTWLLRGFLTNVLNPKVGVFYVSFLPQFIPAGTEQRAFIFLLAAIHTVLGLVWFALLIAALTPLSALLRRPAVVRWLDRVTGGVFLVFGVRLALAHRP